VLEVAPMDVQEVLDVSYLVEVLIHNRFPLCMSVLKV